MRSAGVLAGQHVGAQRDHRAPAEARVPRAVVGGRVGEVDRARARSGSASTTARCARAPARRPAAARSARPPRRAPRRDRTRRARGSRPPPGRRRRGRRRSGARDRGRTARGARGGRPSRRGGRPARRRRRGPPAARARCAGRPPCAGTIPRRAGAPPPRRSSRARDLEPDARAARRRRGRRLSRPPIDAARSRMSAMPKCPSPGPPSSSAPRPRPSSSTVRARPPSAPSRVTSTWPAPAWRSTLASASPRTRSTTAVTSGSAGSTAVAARSSTGSPRSRARSQAAATASCRPPIGTRVERSSRRARTMRCAAPTASRRRARLSLAWAGRRLGVQQRDLALGQREVLGQAVVDVGRQAQALALDLGARDALAQARGGDARAQQVAEDGEHRRARLLEREAGGAARRRPRPRTSSPASSGSTSHAEAGGSKGLATSQVAGSWKTSARPPAEASRHASCSKRSSSSRPTVSTSAPETAKRRRIGTSSASGR